MHSRNDNENSTEAYSSSIPDPKQSKQSIQPREESKTQDTGYIQVQNCNEAPDEDFEDEDDDFFDANDKDLIDKNLQENTAVKYGDDDDDDDDNDQQDEDGLQDVDQSSQEADEP